MNPISLEQLLERYNRTAIIGARALGLNAFASVAADDFRGKNFDWLRKVLAGIEPSIFREQKIDYSHERAERVAQFLSDMLQAGYSEPLVRRADSVHIQRIRTTYVPLERAIATVANKLGIEHDTLKDTLSVDYVKAQIITFPTAFGDMKFVHETMVGRFIKNLEYWLEELKRKKEYELRELKSKEERREKALIARWEELRWIAQPASAVYEKPEEEKIYTPPAGQLKLPFLFTKEVYTGLVTVLRQFQTKKVLYSGLAGLLNHFVQVRLEEQAAQIKPYVNELIEIAKAGITGYDQSKPVGVALVWDKVAYERAVKESADKRTIDDLVTAFNALPEEVTNLNPVQLIAMIIYTLPIRHERKEFSQEEYLQLMGRALHIYKTISEVSEVPFPQGEMPLRFFRETFPRIIDGAGYTLASIGLQYFAQVSILNERFRLSGKELSAIIRNIENSPGSGDVLQDFHIFEGLNPYLFVGDKEANEQIREIVWRSVPRLIEGKGYVRYQLGRLPFVDVELAKNGGIEGLVENFEGTADGNVYYIVPDGQNQLEGYNAHLARQQRLAERQAEQQTKRRPQVNHTPHLPVAQPRIEEKAKVPQSAVGSLETAVTNGAIANADAPDEEYQHPVYSHLSELRSNLHSLLDGDKRRRQAVLAASNMVLNYVNGLPQTIGRDVAVQLGNIVKDSKTAPKVGENTVWNKIRGLQEDYVGTYGSLTNRISYGLGRLVGR